MKYLKYRLPGRDARLEQYTNLTGGEEFEFLAPLPPVN